MKKDIKSMKIIPEPAPNTRSIFAPTFKGPVFKGSGSTSFKCGKCGTILFEKIERNQVQNIVVKCGGCGSFNEIDPTHQGN